MQVVFYGWMKDGLSALVSFSNKQPPVNSDSYVTLMDSRLKQI